MNKLKFWKHDEFDSDIGSLGEDLGLPPEPTGLNEPGFGADKGFGTTQDATHKVDHNDPYNLGNSKTDTMQGPQYSPEQLKQVQLEQKPMQQFQQSNPGADLMEKDIQLISSKLDLIKATLDNMNQRLANLEQIAHGDDHKKQW